MGSCDSIQVSENGIITVNTQNSNKNFSPSRSDFLLPNELSIKTPIDKKYTLSPEFLGKGASGIVSEATDAMGKKFAIKTINKLIIKNITNITSEVEISLSLSNKHIVKCYEVYENLKTISFVLELIQGGDLLDYILNSPLHHLTDEEALDFIIQILETLKYLHIDKNIIHRDIKPENFLVTVDNSNENCLKLIDFGFASYIPKRGKLEDNLGSPIYTAPEIIQNLGYDAKADIWSAGVILFNMLTGFQPFNSDKEEDIDQVVLTKAINFNSIQNVYLRKLCKQMLQKDNNKRFDVVQALELAGKIKKNFKQ